MLHFNAYFSFNHDSDCIQKRETHKIMCIVRYLNYLFIYVFIYFQILLFGHFKTFRKLKNLLQSYQKDVGKSWIKTFSC